MQKGSDSVSADQEALDFQSDSEPRERHAAPPHRPRDRINPRVDKARAPT